MPSARLSCEATPVKGGYRLSGRWNFSSCVNVADWNMLAVTVREGERISGYRMCLLHKSEYEVLDDWRVLGMRAGYTPGGKRATARSSAASSLGLCSNRR